MCRHATQVLAPEPGSGPAAREFLRERAVEWDLLPLLRDAQLAVTELVTNAVIHARTPLVTSVSCADGVFELAVFDGNPTLPTLRPTPGLSSGLPPEASVTAGSGRGLLLVAALAAE